MFKSARIKITAWYLLAILVISFIFSIAIYRTVASDLNARYENIENYIRNNVRDMKKIPPVLKDILQNDLRTAKQRVVIMLLFANGAIIIISAFVGYFLAGRTLRPIEEMVEEQNRFITDASHELRTPLAALKTSTEVALRGRKMSGADARKILEENLEDIDKLELLSGRLLHLAQYQKGERVLAFERIDLGSTINISYKKILPLANKRKIKIDLDVRDNYIEADRVSIEELILILLDNAVKYTPEGGSVSLSSMVEGRNAVIRISDSGPGISSRDIPHIFDRFYRVDQSRSKVRVSGFGLGLSIVKRIVELHQGSVNVSSEIGHGSTFIVKLPTA
ncbi:MAG: HAMP domain-containing histidine kinase [Actinomycetota bacterium]|nr:MAG: HAMP domain-containing histidine kinase [Actinomycetota bacterium]